LGIVTTLKPMRSLPPELGIRELYIDYESANRLAEPVQGFPRDWREIFVKLDGLLKFYETSPIARLREAALKKAEKWILDRWEGWGALGAIFRPMVYLLIVYRALGYPDDHPRVVKAHQELRDFYIREGDTIRLQPCHSPVWDTGLALHALAEAGLEPHSDP